MPPWRRPFALLVLVVAIQRFYELVISRRNERRSGTPLGTGGKRSFPLMVLLHMALFWMPLVERRLRPPRPRLAIAGPAMVACALATALRLWVIRSLGIHWNVRGTIHAGMKVVVTGPYRYLRHPNYVAVALEMAALPLAGSAPISAALLSAANALVLIPRVRGEEALLDAIPGYRERMGEKPRFIPRLHPRQ
jgi:methyltransferase